jgi:uncharacterized membrane protein YfcA
LSLTAFTIACTVVALGTCVQASLGFGLGLIAAPVLAFLDADFVPGPVLILALALTIVVARRERGALDWRGLKWAFLGRVPGSVLGIVAIVWLPEQWMLVLFSILILSGVLLSAAGWTVDPTKPALFGAGATSGFMGSLTSVGGPPMALLYQRHSGPQLRATLAAFFTFGATLSLVLLVVAGEVHTADIGRAGSLLPAMLVGLALSHKASRWLDGGHIRTAILVFSGFVASALLVTTIVTWN